jgi:pimeloyl-ACP methyl ester carboxylesterase
MKKITIESTTLAFEIHGSGEPVLFIHGSLLADALRPLVEEPSMGSFRRIHYHRRGYGQSAPAAAPLSIEQQARDARALLGELGIARAHVVGHSYGGSIALELARQEPEAVQSLALLEPALMFVPSVASFFAAMETALGHYHAGRKREAAQASLSALTGKDFARLIERALPPGALAQAERDAPTFFEIEVPALQEWTLSRGDLAAIAVPTLSVRGEASLAIFQEGDAILREELADVSALAIPDVTHALQIADARSVASGWADFVAVHALGRA